MITEKEHINEIPPDVVHLEYMIPDKINFEIPKTITTFYITNWYRYDLSFLNDTNITTLGIWREDKLLNNIPLNIEHLIVKNLYYPLENLPITLRTLTIYNCQDRTIIDKSKIPFGCVIFIKDKVYENI
jgi:hypothetical protein